MSYDLNVYARHERLPTPERLAAALAAASPPIVVSADFPDMRHLRSGFAPVRLDDRETGFELYSSPIPSARAESFRADVEESGESITGDNAIYLEALTTCDRMFLFVCHDEIEQRAATIVADVLARLCGGYFSDPQSDTMKHANSESEELAP